MFEVGLTEVLLILLVAFLLLGPSGLRTVARSLGRTFKKFQAAMGDQKIFDSEPMIPTDPENKHRGDDKNG